MSMSLWDARTKEDVHEALTGGANVHIRDGDGYTPLHSACRRGYYDVAMSLIDNGADLHARSDDLNTPLHSVYSRGGIELAMALIARGANIYAENQYQQPPPVALSHPETVALFDHLWYFSPIMKAMYHNDVDRLRQLSDEYPIKLADSSEDEWTALHAGAYLGCFEGVNCLLQSDNIGLQHLFQQTKSNKRSALHIACAKGHVKIVAAIIQAARTKSVHPSGSSTSSGAS